MTSIPIILGSTRRGRKSDRVASYMEKRLEEAGQVATKLLDLRDYQFPMLEERFRNQENPPDWMVEVHQHLDEADALVVVSPEYNHGYPAVLKNMFDHFLQVFHRKPVGIITVSGGPFGGIDCLGQLRQVTLGMGAVPIPVAFPITKVGESFDEQGKLLDPSYEGRSKRFIEELLWFVEATRAQKARDRSSTQR